MTLTIGSLFSGIGGLDLGLERAGLGPVRWFVESEPYCRAMLARHWPEVPCFDDVRTVGARELSPVDLIAGGFPCQGISVAGRKRGLADPRSGLWEEFARIVRELRPRVVVVENAPRLAVDGLDRVLGDLAGLGFDAEWFPLAARDVGAPHGRERLFVVAYTRHEPASSEQREQHAQRSDVAPTGGAGVGDPDGGGCGPRSGLREEGAGSGRGLPHDASREGRAGLADGDGVRFEALPPARLHAHGEPGDDAHRCHRFPPRRGDKEGWRAYVGSGGPEPGLRRSAHGVSAGMDDPGFVARFDAPRLAALGNAVVPQVGEAVGYVVKGILAQLARTDS